MILVGIYGELLVFKEGSDVTNSETYLWIELDGHFMVPTNMRRSSPVVAELAGSLVFSGIQFPIKYGPYYENKVDNYIVSYQGCEYRFEVGKNGKLIAVVLK
jgi:hypothetical protein